MSLPPLPGAESITLKLSSVQMGGYAWWQPQAAPAVLLYHGWGQSALDMADVARLFYRQGLHAVSLSMRGWPGSTGKDDYGRSNVGDTEEVLRWLEQQPNVFGTNLLGFSMGGIMALLTATLGNTNLCSVTAVSSPIDLRRVYQTTSYEPLREYYDQTFTPEQWADCSPSTHAQRLNIPALVVVGLQDRLCLPAEGQSYASASGARLLELPEMKHLPRAGDWETIVAESLAMIQAGES